MSREGPVEEALRLAQDRRLFESLLSGVNAAVDRLGRKPVLMEVCGSHTWAISHTGVRDLLKDRVDLISGPGCPVCVTSAGEIGRMVDMVRRRDVIAATYGDMLRVPGPEGSLEEAAAEGRQVRVVYSAMDALDMAEKTPGSEVVFLGVGFETTAPASAVLLKVAKERRIRNVSLYSAHKLMPEAMKAILSMGDIAVDGLLLPGHVSAVTGRKYFDFVGRESGFPAVVSGFEACDILYSVLRLVEKVSVRDFTVENGYPRAVSEEGNRIAMGLLDEMFEKAPGQWRGLGTVEGSALGVPASLGDLDAAIRFDLPALKDEPEPPGCDCAAVLTGRKRPGECALFGTACDPSHPVGPCMVSSEGSCRAHFAFGRQGT